MATICFETHPCPSGIPTVIFRTQQNLLNLQQKFFKQLILYILSAVLNLGYNDIEEVIPEDNPNSGQGVELGLVNMQDGTAMCLRCNKSYSTPAKAKIHFKEVHATDKNDRKFPCPICQKSFAVQRYLTNHIRQKHGLTSKMLQQNYVPN